MKLTKPLVFLLPLILSALACTLTTKPTPTPQGGAVLMVAQTVKLTMTAPATITPSPTPQTCQVKTGLTDGTLNLRACSGIACPILTTINEGETLTITQVINGWLKVTTAGGLTGWVNSKFTDYTNEVTK